MTEGTEAQREIERLRIELAHAGRVTLMGQLTASLTHQLLQPITAILGNAEAAQRMLQATPRNDAALAAILGDIIDSGKAAAAVIHGVAGLLRKEPAPFELLDFNRLMQDVTDVMRSELILREVSLVTSLDPQLAPIRGDPVQLRQVILNLVLNGMEAMNDCAPAERNLVISTASHAHAIELIVRDQGPTVEPVFQEPTLEPVFTTKPEGSGTGLDLCAEIVRAHGGRLWAEPNNGPGSSLRCLIPIPGRHSFT